MIVRCEDKNSKTNKQKTNDTKNGTHKLAQENNTNKAREVAAHQKAVRLMFILSLIGIC